MSTIMALKQDTIILLKQPLKRVIRMLVIRTLIAPRSVLRLLMMTTTLAYALVPFSLSWLHHCSAYLVLFSFIVLALTHLEVSVTGS